jgi:K(+)-stimulated pyrophosphate-energized sodium pump
MTKATPEQRAIFDAADGVADYGKCIDISTKASIREMVLPGLLAIAVPVAVGFIGGAEMLGGVLAGVTTCGVLMAIFQSNAGGAWDNAKKTIEEQGKKGTDAHKAAVVGDTVGDPFKDTSGPSLNILLKLMSVVALVIAPSIAVNSETMTAYNESKATTEVVSQQSERSVEVSMENNEDGTSIATVVTTIVENGEKSISSQVFEGTEEEVKAKIAEFNKASKDVAIHVEHKVEEVKKEMN